MKKYEVLIGANSVAGIIGGPYSIVVIKDHDGKRSLVSSCFGIQSAMRANALAMQYSDTFGATLPWGFVDQSSEVAA